MSKAQPYHFKSIAAFHQFRGLPQPENPLISLIDVRDLLHVPNSAFTLINDFYSISLKRNFPYKVNYGQQSYDFNDGVMFFTSPGQVLRLETEDSPLSETSGWIMAFHPDLLWNTPLAKTIRQYEYFDYAVNEALFLSGKEETIINDIVQNIKNEYSGNMDRLSHAVIIAQLDLLLIYAERSYQRQFMTRRIASHQLLSRLEDLLSNYFSSPAITNEGLPSVKYIAEQLNISPGYLSSLLKSLTGQNTQQHLHNKLIEVAKQKLSTTTLSVSEIAYELGFEHLASFSKLFKAKTKLSPQDFRASFN